MYLEIVTTITSKIPLTDDGLGRPEHSVDIDATAAQGIPTDAIYAVIKGALRSTNTAVVEAVPRLADEEECPFDCDTCHAGDDDE